MTRDIADLLAGAVEERAHRLADLRPTPAAFALTRVRIRRRRIVRHTVETGAGVAVSGVLAAGVWFGTHLDRVPAPPAQTPPTATPTPAPTTPAPAPSVTEEPPAPIEEPGQPAALPAPADLVDRMGDGWVLAIYRSDPPDADPTLITSQVLYAIAPDGTIYRLAAIADDDVLRLLDWRAGEDRALVAFGPPASEFIGAAWLDLRTGALTSGPVEAPGGSLFVAALDDGSQLWQTSTEGQPLRLYATTNGAPRLVGELGDAAMTALVSPAEGRVATLSTDTRELIALDLASGQRRTVDLGAGQMCTLLGWLDDASVLVQCFDPTGGDRVVDWHPHLSTVDVGTGTVAEVAGLGVGQPFVPMYASGIGRGGAEVAFPAYVLDDQLPTAQPCSNSVWQWSPAGLEQLWAMGSSSSDGMTLTASGRTVYVEARPGCMSGLGSDELVAVAPDGSVRVVAPAPAPVDGVAWLTDLSWVPAG